MSPSITTETRRRIALGLIARPAHANRYRYRRRRNDGFQIIVLVACAAALAALIGLSKI